MKNRIKEVLVFSLLFLSFCIANYISDIFIRPNNIDFLRIISVALGVTLGISIVYSTIKKISLRK